MSLPAITPPSVESIRPIEETPKPHGNLGEGFGKALAEARGMETRSNQASERFAHGDPGIGIHEIVIAAEKTNIAVRYATTLKNKAVEAYRELMNTQV